MITDDERRDVARKLRKCTPPTSYRQSQGGGWAHLCDMALAVGFKREDNPTACEFARRLADLIEPEPITEGEPPYNLYSLYEAVLRRHPRSEYAIEDDEVDELVDALLEICNAPGHELIQRPQPSCDRDALLELVKELELGAQCFVGRKWLNMECERMAKHLADDYETIARRIREALGARDG